MPAWVFVPGEGEGHISPGQWIRPWIQFVRRDSLFWKKIKRLSSSFIMVRFKHVFSKTIELGLMEKWGSCSKGSWFGFQTGSLVSDRGIVFGFVRHEWCKTWLTDALGRQVTSGMQALGFNGLKCGHRIEGWQLHGLKDFSNNHLSNQRENYPWKTMDVIDKKYCITSPLFLSFFLALKLLNKCHL